ncbi:DUF6894 family protein [Aliirhizobium smilacinae]|uniref:DUF6894 domain-containing protein n=1 Tax=Aliirhizobium smilacinae TaxID=1395944 RepID=A0A5C4XSA7_9HYPH|nr:hypothetical protein FHP24_08465 [Rhizobium smilacinae]
MEKALPTYRFNFHSANTIKKDHTGQDLASDFAAFEEGVAAAREIVSQRVRIGEPLGRDAYEVLDEWGQVVHIITLRSVVNLG